MNSSASKDNRFGLSIVPKNDRSGTRIEEWTLLKISHAKRYEAKSGKNKGHRTVTWFYLCQCSCGAQSVVSWSDLKQGKSTRCRGCSLKINLINSQIAIKRFGKENTNYRGTNDVPGRWFSRIKRGAKIRNIKFDLTIEDLQVQWVKQKGLCFYTGLSLVFPQKGAHKDTNKHISLTASLDRLDSSKGYDITNIAWVSKSINRLKMDLPHNSFVKMCEMVYTYSKRGMYEQRKSMAG